MVLDCNNIKKTNYLFVDGRYTLKLKNSQEKILKYLKLYTLPKNLLKFTKLRWFDPKLFTEQHLNYFDKTHLIPFNLILK